MPFQGPVTKCKHGVPVSEWCSSCGFGIPRHSTDANGQMLPVCLWESRTQHCCGLRVVGDQLEQTTPGSPQVDPIRADKLLGAQG